MNGKQKIKSPEEVRKLMEELWINHKLGYSLPKDNVFIVELPPLTKDELEIMNR